MKSFSFCLFCSLILLAIGGCHSREMSYESDYVAETWPIRIDLEEGLSNPTTLRLSDIADSIRFLPLETSAQSLFVQVTGIDFCDGDIFLSAHGGTHAFFRFGMDGTYKNSIRPLGRGPGEVPSGSEFSIDHQSRKIAIRKHYYNEYLQYDFDGRYLGKLEIKNEFNCNLFCWLNSGNYLQIFNAAQLPGKTIFSKDFPFLYVKDSLNRIVTSLINPILHGLPESHDKVIGSPFARLTYYKNEVIISGGGLDTVYKIINDTIVPVFYFNTGKYNGTYMQRFSVRDEEQDNFLLGDNTTFESEDRVFRSYWFRGRHVIFEFNKETKQTQSQFFETESKYKYAGLTDDLAGGAYYLPYWTNREGDVWIMPMDAFKFRSEYLMAVKENQNDFNPSQRQTLLETLEKVRDEDNPVLILLFLKKDPH